MPQQNSHTWQTKKLGEICKKASSNISQNQLSDNNGIFPIYGASGLIKNVDFYHQAKEYIGIVKDGAGIGRLALLPARSSVIGTMQYILPEEGVDIKFLFYSLLSIDFLKYKQGSTIPHIYFKDYSEEEIVIPPLPEQLRIVSILDEAFEKLEQAKKNAEKNLQNAKDIFESYLQNIFANPGENWDGEGLGNLWTITSSKRIFKSEYTKSWVPFYRTKEIKEISNWKEISLELFISRERYLEIKKSFGVPQISDLLLSAVWTIGEIMVIKNDDEFYFKDWNILWFKGFDSIDVNYLKFALTAFVEKIKSLAIGAAYSALTIEKLNKYKIYFPKSLSEQLSIVSSLNTLSTETKRLQSIYQQKLANLGELKKSLLKKAFNGEL